MFIQRKIRVSRARKGWAYPLHVVDIFLPKYCYSRKAVEKNRKTFLIEVLY
jgi:hypothetical protein